MVSFLHDGAIKEGKKEEIETPLLPDSKKSSLPDDTLDNCIPELEDISELFTDSFLDFDSFDGWLMADLERDPFEINAVGGELGGCKENLELCSDGICKRGEVKEEFGGKEVAINQEKEENGVFERSAEMCSEGVCENVKEKVLGDSSSDLGGFGCLIEEKLGKVSLDGALKKMDENESGSDEESESESSSDSSSSSSSDEEEEDQSSGEQSGEKKNKKKGDILDEHTDVEVEDGEIMLSDADEMVTWGDDEDDDGGGSRPIKSKNELQVLPPVPPVSVTLEPHHQTLPVGIILSIIETQVVVEGVEKHNPLNEGSILWITESRTPLGIVDEIFGPVKNPYYIVRYNSETEVPSGIEQGTLISFVQEFADHVLNDKSLYQKGYDASNENDEELSDDLEFSDDEKEAEYKRSLKMKKRGTNESKPGNKRKDKRQQKNQKGNWNQNQDNKLPVIIEDQQFNPPVGTSSNQENRAVVPPFPQGPQAQVFSAPNGVWSNGFPPHQQQGMNLPTGLPNGMMWMQQNLPYQLYQTPLQMNPAFQQQISMIPGMPMNFNAMGGQPNFGGGPSLGPWPMGQGQNPLNPLQFGMALQGQHPLLPMNGGGEQQVQSQGSPNMNFNQGRGGGGGHRGGGEQQFQSQGSPNMNFNQGRGGGGGSGHLGGAEQVQSQGSPNMNFNQGRGGGGEQQVQPQGSPNMNFNQGRDGGGRHGGGGGGRHGGGGGGRHGGGGGGRRGHHRGRGRFGGGRGRQS